MILIWIIFGLTAGIAFTTLVVFQRQILLKYWPTIGLVNIWFLIFWIIGESVARQNHLWHISFDSFSSTEILGTQLGNIIYFVVVNTILSTVAIIMYHAYRRDLRFRDIFFKKE